MAGYRRRIVLTKKELAIRSALFLLAFSLFIENGHGQDRARLSASYLEGSIELDGHLSEAIWREAEKADRFIQQELNEGEPATERTEVAVVYTDRALLIGAWCYDDEPGGITARELQRDFNNSRDDDFQVILDTYDDDRNGFLFITNPLGARRDAQVFDNGEGQGGNNLSWDGVWEVATTKTDSGWFAEIRIPFSTLKFPSNVKEQEWGINFERNIRRKREKVLWQGWSRDYALEQVSQAGTLTGLTELRDEDFVEIKPYALGGWKDESAQPAEGLFDVGGDINYLITPTLQGKLTINTDFAQAQSDPQRINLTRFPLVFPEQREFFLEGEDFFDMGFGGNRVIPFQSRRIGLTDDGQKVPIIAGGRLLGKVRNSTVGAMSIQTAEKGDRPSRNYTLFSWREDVLEQSTIGGMTVNKYRNGRLHTTTGINGNYSTASFLDGKNLSAGAAYVHTYDSDKPFNGEASAFRVQASYPNDRTTIFTSFQRSPAPFDPEVGLERRENFQEAFAMWRWNPRPSRDGWLGWIQQFDLMPGMITYTYFDDTKELQTFDLRFQPFGFTTRSGESVQFTLVRNGEGVRAPFSLSEDVVIPAATYWSNSYRLNVSTFSGRVISGSLGIRGGEFLGGDRQTYTTGMNWRLSKFLTVSLDYERNQVDVPTGEFSTDLWRGTFDYAFMPDLFGTVFAQWNDQDELAQMNYRLEWIPKPGTRFFFIFDQDYSTQGTDIHERRTTIRGKLIWRIAI